MPLRRAVPHHHSRCDFILSCTDKARLEQIDLSAAVRGAPMENLAHSASFDSDDNDAPSKLGIKHLAVMDQWSRS